MTPPVRKGDEVVSVVWIIDPEQWPRALLRAELIERGVDAVGYLAASDALARLGARFPDRIVVDLKDATREDIAQLFQVGVPVIGIVAMPEPAWVRDFPWTALLRRPVSVGEIAEVVLARSVNS
jgi:AmiR/NasT family two-component response regulator